MIQDLWYKNAVFYSLDLETFMDLNGDGIGDFEGLSSRLDYLHSLGIDTIWLAPFQLSPNKDNGYDVKDYYSVDPRHGTLGHFVEFIHQARKRGIKVIIDLVVNHTSDKHPWFQNARKGVGSKYYDWYVWSKKKPKDWNKGMAFPGVQKATWTYDKKAKAYYHHRFYEYQPDLNIDNPEVREEINRIMGFWLELGISGFRIDAVPFILEEQIPGDGNKKIRFNYLRDIRRFAQWRKGDSVMLGEANVLPKDSAKYFGKEGEGIHLMFNFYVNQYLFYALATADIKPLMKALEDTRIHFPNVQWAHFLRNHDELDLGRLTKTQRQKVFDRFGPDENMQLFERGIRRRLSPMLATRKQTEFAYSLMFSLPGAPVLRYGDEIGMGENLELEERNSVRTPMQWSAEKNAGFSTAKKLVHPIIKEGEYDYKLVNVETQQRDRSSLLNWMTSLIRLRQECVEIGLGEWKFIKTSVPQVFAIQYEYQGSCLCIFHNFDSTTHEFDVDFADQKITRLINMMALDESVGDRDGVHHINLGNYGYKLYRAGGLGHFVEKK
jgi:maltose alpha-D-glucosyltransferase / alpha-amylase